MRRRGFLALSLLPFSVWGSKVQYPQVTPKPLQFPRDHGAHPDFRIEWWYITGWLDHAMGFQVTFFRARPEEESDNPSSFNPRQVLFAHAAISDPKRGRLVHDQRAARAGLSLAHVENDRTGISIDDWSLVQDGKRYRAEIVARDFEFDLTCFADEIVLQGDDGLSRKGHRPEEASYYYSRPNMHVIGSVNGKGMGGSAWLDHEWSSAYMAPEATGWDWCGINMLDGQSLMAFRMRDKAGGTHFAPPGTSFKPLRMWKSPRTGVEYPVEMEVRTFRDTLVLKPLMDDQELDSRQSTGTIYWEGAVSAFRKNTLVGRGYLELTGYWKPMKL
ncbi:MAG TPA: lipocalin-like domain-containing protein [Burkholderiales bacterium]|nr:lipocalin-like domain-containing protein [Burkholderiales bacterium]